MLIFNLIKIFTRNEIKKKQVSTWRDSTDTEYSISLLQKGRNATQFASESWLLPKCTSYTWEIAFRNSICPVIPETKMKISIIPVIPKGMEYCTQVKIFFLTKFSFDTVPWCVGQNAAKLNWTLYCHTQTKVHPPPTATNKMLQGEHFNKQLEINLHQLDNDTLLTHTHAHKFLLNNINCYKYVQLNSLIPGFKVPLNSSVYILQKAGGLKLSSAAIRKNALTNSGMTKP